MGRILTNFKKDAIKSFFTGIANTDMRVYLFVGGASSHDSNTTVNESYQESVYRAQSEMMFGKQLLTAGATSSADANGFAFMTQRYDWANNTAYSYYDSANTTIYDNNFYVVSNASVAGQSKYVYKCIWNNGGGTSKVDPSVSQSNNPIGGLFTTSDGYTWTYMYAISDADWNKFATTTKMPVFANNVAIAAANDGISYVKVENAGSGYSVINGTIASVVNSTTFQITSNSSVIQQGLNAYQNSFIYIVSSASIVSNTFLRRITDSYKDIYNYIYVRTDVPIPSVSQVANNYASFLIGPYVDIKGDGTGATAWANVSSANTINNIVVLNRGSGYTRATISIYNQFNSGSGATGRAIISPPKGHGVDPFSELGVDTMGVYAKFANSADFTSGVTYNTVGLIVDPKNRAAPTTAYSNGSFSQLMSVNLSSAPVLSNNELLVGNGHIGYFVKIGPYANSAYIIGDKTFANGEVIYGSLQGNLATYTITGINTYGHLDPVLSDVVYINNLSGNGVTRSASSNEEIKLAIQF
jgi:hypothetical protein